MLQLLVLLQIIISAAVSFIKSPATPGMITAGPQHYLYQQHPEMMMYQPSYQGTDLAEASMIEAAAQPSEVRYVLFYLTH